jgi:DNA-binding beta-propeller fold protein YncE
MPRSALAALIAAVIVTVAGPVRAHALQITGLQHPDSFVADLAGAQYFISNVNGDAEARDNNGFISKLDKTGAVVHLHFVQGGVGDTTLHAPKGMTVIGETLYVADLDAVRGFHTGSGRAIVTVPVHGELAGVAHDGHGLLYVSEPGGNTIYRIDTAHGHAVSVVAHDTALAGPRGLAVHPTTGHIIAVSWDKGKILDVTPNGPIVELVSNSFFSSRFGHLRGVDFDSWGNMYVSDFTAGKIWRMAPDRQFKVIAEFLPAPAGIGVDREKHLILVPYAADNVAEMNGLESPVKQNKQKRTLKDYGFEGMKPVPKREDK